MLLVAFPLLSYCDLQLVIGFIIAHVLILLFANESMQARNKIGRGYFPISKSHIQKKHIKKTHHLPYPTLYHDMIYIPWLTGALRTTYQLGLRPRRRSPSAPCAGSPHEFGLTTSPHTPWTMVNDLTLPGCLDSSIHHYIHRRFKLFISRYIVIILIGIRVG